MEASASKGSADKSAPIEENGFDMSQLAMYSTFNAKARYLQLTGKRMRRSNKRRRTKNSTPSKKVEALFSAEWDPAFMSEIQLQGVLDRTKADEQDEAAMDMITINGIRMSKYDIRALKIGSKVPSEC
jgi:hypothetical protein